MRFPAAAMLFGFISRMRTGVRFAVDTFLGFTVWVRELKIPRTPERRVSPLCRRVRFRSRPAFAIFAHIPPPSILQKYPRKRPKSNQNATINAHYSWMGGISAARWRLAVYACDTDRPPSRRPSASWRVDDRRITIVQPTIATQRA